LKKKGECTMTTQTEITKTNKTIHAPFQIKRSTLQIALAVLLIVSIVGVLAMAISPADEINSANNQALMAMSARYQGLADMYAKEQAALARGWAASAARYQGLADSYASAETRAIAASTARHQGLADLFARNETALARGWAACAARYQGLANYHALSELSPAYQVMAFRYQGMAQAYFANQVALERGWLASAARYQGLADHFKSNDK
jgi:hypothetical protein